MILFTACNLHLSQYFAILAVLTSIILLLDRPTCRYNPCLNGGTCHSNEDGTNYCECADGFQGQTCNEFQAFGLEFVVVKYGKKNWTDAQVDCVQRGYNLTSIISVEEAEVLRPYA